MKFWKKIMLLGLLVFMIGCTNLSKQQDLNHINFYDEDFKKYYETWQLDKALKRIKVLENSEEDAYNNIDFSHVKQIIEKRQTKKEELEKITVNIKKSILEDDIQAIEKYIDKTLINVLKFKELKKYNFSGLKVYGAKIHYLKDSAEAIYAFYYMDDIYYYALKFSYKNERWVIVDFVEKAGV